MIQEDFKFEFIPTKIEAIQHILPKYTSFVCEELDGCAVFGDSREEALQELVVAMKLWLDSGRKHGDPIQKPRKTNPAFHKEILPAPSQELQVPI